VGVEINDQTLLHLSDGLAAAKAWATDAAAEVEQPVRWTGRPGPQGIGV